MRIECEVRLVGAPGDCIEVSLARYSDGRVALYLHDVEEIDFEGTHWLSEEQVAALRRVCRSVLVERTHRQAVEEDGVEGHPYG